MLFLVEINVIWADDALFEPAWANFSGNTRRSFFVSDVNAPIDDRKTSFDEVVNLEQNGTWSFSSSSPLSSQQ